MDAVDVNDVDAYLVGYRYVCCRLEYEWKLPQMFSVVDVKVDKSDISTLVDVRYCKTQIL